MNNVLETLAKVDPLGLIADGAPFDEYAPEVPDLTRLIEENEVNASTVNEVFERWFYPNVLPAEMLDKLVTALTSI